MKNPPGASREESTERVKEPTMPIVPNGRPAPKPKTKISQTVRTQDDLIERTKKDIASIGVVGEETNALLIYLAYTSRLLDDPVAVVTRGHSSTGKSTLLYKVSLLFPPESKFELMRMTDASLFNAPVDALEHKILITGERRHTTDEAAFDANSMIRQLLSEKRVTRSVSVPGGEEGGGRWVTEIQERKGPVAFAESTTAGSIFEEDLNRMLEVFTDETDDQNLAVMLAIGNKHDQDPAGQEAVIAWHHEFQRGLGRYKVRVPFWEAVARGLPRRDPRCRRIAQQVLSVIEASALLHQHERKTDGDYLTATVGDYAIARGLLIAPLHAATGIGPNYDQALKLRKKIPQGPFTAAQVKRALGLKNDMAASRLLAALVGVELVHKIHDQKGPAPATYTWAHASPPDLSEMVLPPVEEVKG
jgi:hypothetical protein